MQQCESEITLFAALRGLLAGPCGLLRPGLTNIYSPSPNITRMLNMKLIKRDSTSVYVPKGQIETQCYE